MDLSKKLPARVTGCDWRLMFSTTSHGYSLAHLYRYQSALIMVILIWNVNNMLKDLLNKHQWPNSHVH